MAKYPGVSAFWNQPILGAAPPPPDPDPVIRFNPNYVWQLASSLLEDTVFSQGQRGRIADDIAAINTATSGAIKPDVCGNWSWDDAETSLGVYNFAGVPARLKAISTAAGCKWYLKLFYRSYGSSHAVPTYMQSAAGTTYGGGWGSGDCSNGEYGGTSGGVRSFNAKMWVPAVQVRFQAWLQAIADEYNSDTSFGGIVINETSPLNGTGTGEVPVNPEDNATIMYDYWQNLFGSVVNVREAFNLCEVFISPNNPTTIFSETPLNPGVLFSEYRVGNYVQDHYVGTSPTPKASVRIIYQETQPYAVTNSSYGALMSGEVFSHKGVSGFDCTSTSSNSLTTGAKTFFTQTGKAFATAGGDVVNIVHDLNDPTNNRMTGTTVKVGAADAYDTTTGKLTVTISSKVGTGTFAEWTIGKGTNFLPPHTLDEIVTYAVTPFTSQPWSAHSFAGATHMFFQVNSATDLDTENAARYRAQVEYLKVTGNRVVTTRPAGYPSA